MAESATLALDLDCLPKISQETTVKKTHLNVLLEVVEHLILI